MKFPKFFLIFIFISSILLISPVNALVFENVNVLGINNGNGYGSYDSDGTNVFCIHNGSAVFLLDYGAQSITTLMTTTTGFTVKDAYVASDGHLYISTNYGIYKRISTSTNPQEFNTDVYTGTVIPITSKSPERLREEGGFIYYFYGDICYRFSLSNYLESTYLDTNFPMTTSVGVAGFDIYDGDLYFIGYTVSANTYEIYKNTDLLYNMPTTYGGTARTGYLQVVNSGSNTLIYYGFRGYSYSDHHSSSYGILYENGTVYSTSTGISFATITSGQRVGAAQIGSLEPSQAWVNYPDVEVITTEFAGRTSASSGGASGFSYQQANLDSLYDSYYNNSNIQVVYNVKTDALNISQAEDFKNNMQYRIDLIDTNGINIDSKFFYGSEFGSEPISLGILFGSSDAYYKKSGSFSFSYSQNWENGTYNLKLYEINKDTNSLGLLDSDSFTVLPEQLEGSIGSETDTSSTSMTTLEIANSYISSPYTWGSAVTVTFGGIAAVFAGSIGFIIGALLGCAIAIAIGLFPSWVIVAIVIVAIFGLAFIKD